MNKNIILVKTVFYYYFCFVGKLSLELCQCLYYGLIIDFSPLAAKYFSLRRSPDPTF